MKPDPDKSILNQKWQYVPSGETDIGKRFADIRAAEKRAYAAMKKNVLAKLPPPVISIVRKETK